MIKTKLKNIIEACGNGNDFVPINILADTELKPLAAWEVGKIKKEIISEYTDFLKKRVEIAKKIIGDETESDQVSIPKEKIKEVKDSINEILTADVEILASQISLEDITGSVKPDVLEKLKFIFNGL